MRLTPILLLLTACQNEPLIPIADIRVKFNTRSDYVEDTVRSAVEVYPNTFVFVENAPDVSVYTSQYPILCELNPNNDSHEHHISFISDEEFDDVVSECAVRYLGYINDRW